MVDSSRKRAIYIAIPIVLGLVVVWGVFREAPTDVETATSKRGTMTVTVDAEARTRVRNKFTVTAPISGLMARIKLTEGDNVSRNYPLAEIDPNPPIQRTPPSSGRYLNPYSAKVFAPTGGKILRIFDKSERFVAAGTPILELGNPEDVELVVDILSTSAASIRPGAIILIEDQSAAYPVKARVRLVESQATTKISALGVEEQRVNVIGDFLSENSGLGDNFRVDVRIVVWEKDGVLMVPSSAVFRNEENWNVFVVENGNARRRTITVGHQNTEVTEVLGGLDDGETVILHPANKIVDGTNVNVR